MNSFEAREFWANRTNSPLLEQFSLGEFGSIILTIVDWPSGALVRSFGLWHEDSLKGIVITKETWTTGQGPKETRELCKLGKSLRYSKVNTLGEKPRLCSPVAVGSD
jgi:hypothetical protein